MRDIPHAPECVYCILTAAEWNTWDAARPVQELLQLRDEQGDLVVLVRTSE